MPTIVVSGVNLTEGGTLKVFQDCLRAVRAVLPAWRVVVLANNRDVIDVGDVEIIEMPAPKKSWMRRIYAEYVEFNSISKRLDADIWLSMHDMSPRIKAKSQFVYCHNANAFYRPSLSELAISPKLLPFTLLYSIFYRINIRSNIAVIVQQDWLRREFKRRYGVDSVIVAHPSEAVVEQPGGLPARINTFCYPSLSRPFKNFELICEAARLLADHPAWSGRVQLTLSPDDTRLTQNLYGRYGDVRGLEFIGRQDRAGMARLYDAMDCLLFPSRLETWGLPISETKALGKPMIVADLPYAHETVGNYDHVRFVDPASSRALADIMLDVHRNGWSSTPVRVAPVAQPFANSWHDLIKTMVRMHEGKAA
ncbi:glycosyltransferase [Sphingomonas sp. Y38-1Y]|uniref:glycosyltransferase n=1 Tax=Sphingomonas sp. Y38-1Y TaxID=3078265 RepID=UPI0028E1C228|nr:glycosyltransferase [Sphingomonas sp. Y38-1Y]